MADPIFNAKKQAVIDIVKERNCGYANYINANGNSYSDLAVILLRFAKTFDCDPTYLDDLFAPFDDSDLTSNGVYYNKTSVTITNPKYVAKSTDIDIVVDAGGDYPNLEVAYQSEINSLVISNNTIVGSLNVGGGSTVTLLDVEPGSKIFALTVKACDTFNSTIDKIAAQSTIDNFGIDEDANINEIECEINPIV